MKAETKLAVVVLATLAAATMAALLFLIDEVLRGAPLAKLHEDIYWFLIFSAVFAIAVYANFSMKTEGFLRKVDVWYLLISLCTLVTLSFLLLLNLLKAVMVDTPMPFWYLNGDLSASAITLFVVAQLYESFRDTILNLTEE